MLRTHRFRTALLSLLGGLALANPATAATAPAPGGLLVAQGRFGGRLEIESHDVSVTIRDGIAVTTFEEVFRNTENRDVEALYTFPVPKGASVANFSMWIGGKEMVGEVVEKERARAIYESYKAQRIDPGLLEQIDNSTFEMRIFPIGPKAEQRIRVTYYQELDFDADWATYVYPLASASEVGNADTTVHGRFSLNLEVLSDIPIKRIESPSHADAFVWVEHGEHYNQASLEQAGGDLSRDVVLAFQTKRAQTGIDVVASTPPNEDGFFQMTLTAGDELACESQGMDYVFVSDISGSMRHEGKLGLSNGAVEAFIDTLSPDDRMQVISFSIRTDMAFRGLQPVNARARKRAGKFLGRLIAKGGTSLLPALELAYQHQDSDRQLNVVVLSDGLTTEPKLIEAMRARPAGARVFCVGIGNDVNRPLLTQVARDAGGMAEFFSQGDRFDRRAANFRRKLQRPALEDVKLTIDGCQTFDTTADLVGNLFHGSPVRVYGRYAKPGMLELTLNATLGGKPYERTFVTQLPEVARDHPEIERMWASRQIQRLEDRIRGKSADDRTVEDIVMLSEGFSIPSRFASFLVLENNSEFRRWRIERRNATRIVRDRGAQTRLRGKLNDLQNLARRSRSILPGAQRAQAAKPAPVDRPQRMRTPTVRTLPPRSARPVSDSSGSSGGGSFGMFGALVALLLGALGIREKQE